jgi:hypothetical protein
MMPVKSEVQVAYRHERPRVEGILKDVLKTRIMPAINLLYFKRNMQSNKKFNVHGSVHRNNILVYNSN